MKKIEQLRIMLDSKLYWSIYWHKVRKSDYFKVDYYNELNYSIFLWRLRLKDSKEEEEKMIRQIIASLAHQAEKTCGLA